MRKQHRSVISACAACMLFYACAEPSSQANNPISQAGTGAAGQAPPVAGNAGNSKLDASTAPSGDDAATAGSTQDAASATSDASAPDADTSQPGSDAGVGEPSPLRFRVALDLNTYKRSFGTDVATFEKFHSDFLYTISVNGDLTDDDYETALDMLSPTGWAVSEDNPDKSDSYKRVLKALGKVDDSICYNETGATPGGTLLSNAQIDSNAASHGGKVAVISRDYSTRWPEWRKETDRCLDSAKVTAVVMETSNPYGDQDAASLVKAVLAKGKRQYFLLPGYKTAYTLSSLNYLINEAPNAMQDARVHIVIYNYNQPDKWFGGWDTQQGTLNIVYDIAHGAGSATFYAEDAFGGRGVTLGSGDYTQAQLAAIGLANDSTLSVRVYTGTKLTIFQNDGFGGFTTTLVDSVDALSALNAGRASGNWAKDISSLRIERQ